MIKIVKNDGTIEYREGRVNSATSTQLVIIGESSSQVETVDYRSWEEIQKKEKHENRRSGRIR
jgi:hypothetical protein